MIQNISIACDAVFGAGSENFGTVTGNVTFKNGSANSGTINGNAIFEGNAEHKVGAVVTGNATFASVAAYNGTVLGTVTIDSSAADEAAYQVWLAAADGVSQYSVAGVHNGQWAYNKTEYASEAAANSAYEADYQAWLAANVGVGQYPDKFAGTRGGQWAFNSTEYTSQAEAQDAEILSRASAAISSKNLNLLSASEWITYVTKSGISSIMDQYSGDLFYYQLPDGGRIGSDGIPFEGSYQTGTESMMDAWPQIDDGTGIMINDPNWTPTYHDDPVYTSYVNGFPG